MAKDKEPKPTSEATATPSAEGATATATPPAAPTESTESTQVKKRGKAAGKAPPRGKKLKNHLKNVASKLSKEGAMPLKKALTTLKSMKRAKFDETVEIHIKLGIDTTNSDQMVRGSVGLPHGIGKTVKILVFAQGDDIAKAKEAGADFVGAEDIVKKIQTENWLDFDVALATQAMMGQVSRLGKVLGPRNLMPTPKAGTVIQAGGDVAAAVRDFKAGKVEYRADKSGNLHAGIGKLSFDEDKLAANIQAFVDQVRNTKPSSVKGIYVQSITVSATQSPGIHVTM